MEQTLGKRIAQHRKRLELTQDALAEQLGITAQAVSKWENDLSCPDIAMLPRLAEIFGITTDELLGRETSEQVHEGEVVDNDREDGRGVHFQNNNWEFHWDSGRRSAVGFACWVLALGCLLLADNFLEWDVGFWGLAWPSFLLMMGLFGGHRFSFTRLGFVLLGGYFLVDNIGFMPMELGGKIIWPGLVILFGISLLADALRKPKKPKFSVARKGGNSSKTKCDCSNSTDRFSCDLSFGENIHKVDVPCLAGGEANCAFGELTIDLCDCKEVAPGCSIEANCSFGELQLLVPRRFSVQTDSSTAFASVNITGQPDASAQGIIYLEANAHFGEITVRYI